MISNHPQHAKSLSARRAWIEIHPLKHHQSAHRQSLSARRAWIEIIRTAREGSDNKSLSARRAWIEIMALDQYLNEQEVALRKESVDRN